MRGGGRFGKDYKQRLAAVRTKKKQETYSSPPPKEEKPSYNRFASGEVDGRDGLPERVFEEAIKLALPDPKILGRAAGDIPGTFKGAAEVASVASPAANAYRLYKYLRGDGLAVTGADMEDIEQAVEVAALVPQGKAVKVAGKAANAVLRSKTGIEFYQPMKEEAQKGIRPLYSGLGGIFDIGIRKVDEEAAALMEGVTAKERLTLQRELTDRLAVTDDPTEVDIIERQLDELRQFIPTTKPTGPREITFADAKKSAEAILQNPTFTEQAEVVQTVPDRKVFEALRWRVEGGSEGDFARRWETASSDLGIKGEEGPVSFVLRPYGEEQKAAQVQRFWQRSANKALSRAETVLEKAGVDVGSIKAQARNYSSDDIAAMHSTSKNTNYQVWERVEGTPIFFKGRGSSRRAYAKNGTVEYDSDNKIYRIYKNNGEVIEYDPSNKGSYLVHRGDHIDHLIPKDKIAKRIEQLIDDGDVDTATKYYTFMNSANNFFALHGAMNSSKQNAVIRTVDALISKSPRAKRNLEILRSQAEEYQQQLDNAWNSLSDLVGEQEANRFFELYS